MAIQNQYVAVFNTAAGSTVVQAAGNISLHTINFPKATAGLVYLTTGDQATVKMTFPIGSIGSMRLDVAFAAGLALGTMSADAVILAVQTP